MNDLLTRLEALTGSDREVDAMIQVLVFECPEYKFPDKVLNRTPSNWQEACGRFRHDGYGGETRWPEYTRSIDAALTLVPEGYCWQLKQGIGCEVIVWSVTVDYDDDGAPSGTSTIFPAIALCIAALKARGVK